MNKNCWLRREKTISQRCHQLQNDNTKQTRHEVTCLKTFTKILVNGEVAYNELTLQQQ